MDPILYWNEVSFEANRVSHTNGKGEQTGPTLSSRALAIVHLAMYDAYAGVSNDPTNLPPYLDLSSLPPPDPGASPDAAVAAAAHATLSKLFPSQKPFFDLKHLQAGLGGSRLNEGHQFGLLVAQKLLEDRKDDPNASDDGYAASMARGAHRPDPDNPDQGYHAPFYGARSKGFAINERYELATPPFELATPPSGNPEYNPEYRKALREVRGKGIAPELMGTLPKDIEARTVDETLVGIFWAYDGASEIGTPPRLYNQIVRRVAIARNNSVAANARLFAFVNVAMADAGILAWDQKYIHDLWRPVVGIREHDRSMGPAATQADNDISDNCDTSWLPLGAPNSNRLVKNFTPNFPAYPSGHATFGAAAFHITRLFYNQGGKFSNNTLDKDTLFNGLDFVSDEFNGVTTDNKGAVRPRHLRNFAGGLWQMIEENGRSRVDLGVHWVFDAFVVKDDGTPDLERTDAAGRRFGGVPLGLLIAEDIFKEGGGKAPKKSTKVVPRF
jgi:hypothetical protein